MDKPVHHPAFVEGCRVKELPSALGPGRFDEGKKYRGGARYNNSRLIGDNRHAIVRRVTNPHQSPPRQALPEPSPSLHLLGFQFGTGSEPGLVALTVRLAWMVPRFTNKFAGQLSKGDHCQLLRVAGDAKSSRAGAIRQPRPALSEGDDHGHLLRRLLAAPASDSAIIADRSARALIWLNGRSVGAGLITWTLGSTGNLRDPPLQFGTASDFSPPAPRYEARHPTVASAAIEPLSRAR